MTELAVANDLALKRRSTTKLAAQLADDALCLLDAYALAHERRAVTVDAAMAVGGKRADATTQEKALELLDIDMGRGHGPYFRQGHAGSCTLH